MTQHVNYIALADHTGYACAAEQYLRILRQQGVQVHFQPLVPGPGLGLWFECDPSAAPLRPDAPTILHCVPEYYPALRAWLMRRGVNGRCYGMTVWETDKLPSHWPGLLNSMDAILVPSACNQEVFLRSGVTVEVFVLPHASQFEGCAPSQAAIEHLRARLPDLTGKFVFYSIGAWSYRKGNDLLLEAFSACHAHKQNAVLILKTTPEPVDQTPGFWQRVQRKLSGGRLPRNLVPVPVESGVVLLTDDLPAEEIAALHAIGDCYVSCARAEGWGIGLYEAAWFGNLLLAPDKGGHRAYLLSDAFSGLVRSRRVAVRTPDRNRSYTSDQSWDEVDVNSMAAKMRELIDKPDTMQAEAQHLKKALQQSLSSQQIATMFLEILRRP